MYYFTQIVTPSTFTMTFYSRGLARTTVVVARTAKSDDAVEVAGEVFGGAEINFELRMRVPSTTRMGLLVTFTE